MKGYANMSLRVDIVRTASLNAPQGDVAKKDAIRNEKAWRACQEFESILLYHILSSMRKAWAKEEDENQYGFGNEIFKSMIDEQLSLAMARSGGIGIAKMIAQELGVDPPQGKTLSARHCTRNQEKVEEANSNFELKKKNQDASPMKSHEKGSSIRKAFDVFEKRIKPFEGIIRKAADTFGISVDLIKAVIMQESGGNPYAVSPKGAKGLMQLSDATADTLGVTNPFDPVQNIFGGARLLSNLIRRFNGDLKLALASYNAGAAAVEKHKGIPPYRETKEYVDKVTTYLEELRRSG